VVGFTVYVFSSLKSFLICLLSDNYLKIYKLRVGF